MQKVKNMTKEEVIRRYGYDEYIRRKEQHKEYMKRTDYNKKYQLEKPEINRAKVKRYRERHPDRVRDYWKTIKGRAVQLVNAYNMTDKKK